MEQISWTDRVRNEVLYGVKEERNALHVLKVREVHWIGHSFCRSCLLNHAIEGKLEERIEVTGRRGRGLKQLHDDHKEKRGH